jgi:hypothetical protein
MNSLRVAEGVRAGYRPVSVPGAVELDVRPREQSERRLRFVTIQTTGVR